MILKIEVEVKNEEERYKLLNALQVGTVKHKYKIISLEKGGKKTLVENNELPISGLTQAEKEEVRKKRALNMIKNLKTRDLIEVQRVAIFYKIDPRKVEKLEHAELIEEIRKKVL